MKRAARSVRRVPRWVAPTECVILLSEPKMVPRVEALEAAVTVEPVMSTFSSSVSTAS